MKTSRLQTQTLPDATPPAGKIYTLGKIAIWMPFKIKNLVKFA